MTTNQAPTAPDKWDEERALFWIDRAIPPEALTIIERARKGGQLLYKSLAEQFAEVRLSTQPKASQGDEEFVPERAPRSGLYCIAKRYGITITVRNEGNGVRVWRVK